MRAFRKRPWAELLVNMTPLIDVVFLIIIFFIIMINFSELHLRNVTLPRADEALKSPIQQKNKIPITIKSESLIFMDRKKIRLEDLTVRLEQLVKHPRQATVQIRADEDIPYEIIKQVMVKMAQAHISKIEFSTTREAPLPIDREVP